jgi:hypothetical protein
MHRRIHSTKFAEKRRRQRQTIFFLGMLCLVTLSASAIFILRAPFLQVKKVVVEGTTLVSQEAVAQTALSSLSGNYWNIVPRSNIFFYSKNSLSQSVQEKFSEVQDFKVHRNGLSGLKLTLRERVPAAVVCAGFREEGNEGECFWSDSKGFIFGEVTGSTTKIFNHYYVTSEDGVKVGTNFVPEARFTELQKFLGGALRGGLVPLGVLVGDDGQYEMYIKNETGDTEVTVYFDASAPFDTTLENLLAFWQNTVKGKKATSTPVFDYINLRFGNTVYYSAP